MEIELDSLKSVRSFCAAFNERDQPLHFLILNAGIMATESERRITEDGLEEHFQARQTVCTHCMMFNVANNLETFYRSHEY